MGPHQNQPVFSTGRPLSEARAAMILIHGRGASAESILELSTVIDHPDFVYLAPQAAGNSWYPFSFLSPLDQNEPGISSGLSVISDVVSEVVKSGIVMQHIVLGGFSQGACLVAEFVARNPARYGGLLVFSGGLIGPPGTVRAYHGDLDKTPVFLGCSDTDFHIPLHRVEESATVMESLGGSVVKMIYPGMGHTINEDEIENARRMVDMVLQ